jgi:hypothetical protein
MGSPVHGDYRRCQAEIPLIVLFKFAEPAHSDSAADCPHWFHAPRNQQMLAISLGCASEERVLKPVAEVPKVFEIEF